jgi:hypothetical protein
MKNQTVIAATVDEAVQSVNFSDGESETAPLETCLL